MALILNLETATTVCSVALAKEGQLIGLKEVNGDYTHAENLTSFIDAIFMELGYSLKQLDAISVSKGPGSYTGLRIGVSTAKGLCYSLDKPLLAINTLQHSAYACSLEYGEKNDLFCPMIDARRMEVYCAFYDKNNQCIRSTTAEIVDDHSFKDLLEKHTIYFFGDGAEKCRSLLTQHSNARFLDHLFPSAVNMIALSEQLFTRQQFEDIAYFEPFYLKDFIAGRKKEKNQ
jgi:tRNA threonylcarbamoyladenosine biosynthesis protein TsaB